MIAMMMVSGRRMIVSRRSETVTAIPVIRLVCAEADQEFTVMSVGLSSILNATVSRKPISDSIETSRIRDSLLVGFLRVNPALTALLTCAACFSSQFFRFCFRLIWFSPVLYDEFDPCS